MAGLRLILAWFDMRRRLIVVLLAGWTLVIASGSGAAAENARWLGVPRFERVLVPLAILYVAVVVILLVVVVATNVERPTKAPDRRSQRRVLFLLSLLVLLATLFPRESSDDDAPAEPPAPVETTEPASEQDPVEADRNELLPLLGLLAVAVGVLAWTRRRIERPENDVESMSLDAELEPLISRVIGGLEPGTDPRSSVIRSYSQLEDALAVQGEPRLETETPMEHIRRVLAHLDIDTDPVLQLARLYEIARFSDHPVSVHDQHRAIEGLTRVRNDLATRTSADQSVSSTRAAR